MRLSRRLQNGGWRNENQDHTGEIVPFPGSTRRRLPSTPLRLMRGAVCAVGLWSDTALRALQRRGEPVASFAGATADWRSQGTRRKGRGR